MHKVATNFELPSRQFIELYFLILHRCERHVLTYTGHFTDIHTSTGTALLFHYYTLHYPHLYIPMAIKVLLQSHIHVVCFLFYSLCFSNFNPKHCTQSITSFWSFKAHTSLFPVSLPPVINMDTSNLD